MPTWSGIRKKLETEHLESERIETDLCALFLCKGADLLRKPYILSASASRHFRVANTKLRIDIQMYAYYNKNA